MKYIFALVLVVGLVGCSDSLKEQYVVDGRIMGTTYNVKVTSQRSIPEARLSELETVVVSTLERIDEALSTYKPASELMSLNNGPVGYRATVGRDALSAFKLSFSILSASDGYFDPSIGPLVSAWGFGSQASNDHAPTPSEVRALLAQSGMTSVELGQSFVSKVSEGFIDFSAIAKGYAVDQVYLSLKALGFTDVLVEVGGEVRVSGTNVHSKPWRLGIETPANEMRSAYTVVHLNDVSMATSGDYRNFIDGADGRYSHTIDPKTGHPVKTDLASVSVIMQDCASADAWATAFMAMGYEKAIKKAEALDMAAYFIMREEDGFLSSSTKAMQAFILTDT